MTPERLADLRGRVARGELGCGPASAALVAELLDAYDEAVPTRESAEALVRLRGWTQDRGNLHKWRKIEGDLVVAGGGSLAADSAMSLTEWRAFMVIAIGPEPCGHPNAVDAGGCSEGCCDYYRCPDCGKRWKVEHDG